MRRDTLPDSGEEGEEDTVMEEVIVRCEETRDEEWPQEKLPLMPGALSATLPPPLLLLIVAPPPCQQLLLLHRRDVAHHQLQLLLEEAAHVRLEGEGDNEESEDHGVVVHVVARARREREGEDEEEEPHGGEGDPQPQEEAEVHEEEEERFVVRVADTVGSPHAVMVRPKDTHTAHPTVVGTHWLVPPTHVTPPYLPVDRERIEVRVQSVRPREWSPAFGWRSRWCDDCDDVCPHHHDVEEEHGGKGEGGEGVGEKEE